MFLISITRSDPVERHPVAVHHAPQRFRQPFFSQPLKRCLPPQRFRPVRPLRRRPPVRAVRPRSSSAPPLYQPRRQRVNRVINNQFERLKTLPGQWKLGAKLGSGAFGSVFAVRNADPRHGPRQVAIKLVLINPLNPSFAFEEQKALKKAKSNDCMVKSYGQWQQPLTPDVESVFYPNGVPTFGRNNIRPSGCLVLVFERCQQSLEKWLQTYPYRSKLPWLATRWKLAEQILTGMNHIHGKGLIHRDIKPDNILSQQNDNGFWDVKVSDLGIAAEKPGWYARTFKGKKVAPCGTRRYMAPEQSYTEKSDVFSFGVVLNDMFLSGCGMWLNLDTLSAEQIFAYQLYQRCTQHDPKKRPSTKKLLKELNNRVKSIASIHREPRRARGLRH